jgi:hypothetical protein
MEILATCKKIITAEATTKLFFEQVLVHFGIPKTIISYQRNQTDGQTEVVNQMIVHILRMYNSKHPHTWDESLPHV